MIGEGIARAMAAAMVAIAIISAVVTAALIFGIPWLWGLIKPWLHGVTA